MPFFKKSISFLHNHRGGSCARRRAAVNNLRYLQLNLIVRFTPSAKRPQGYVCPWSVVKTIRSNSPFALSESKSFLMLSVLAGNLVLHKLHIGPTRLEFLPLLISVVMYVMFHPSPSPSPVANIHCIGIYPTDNEHSFALHTPQSSKYPQSNRSVIFVFKIFY